MGTLCPVFWRLTHCEWVAAVSLIKNFSKKLFYFDNLDEFVNLFRKFSGNPVFRNAIIYTSEHEMLEYIKEVFKNQPQIIEDYSDLIGFLKNIYKQPLYDSEETYIDHLKQYYSLYEKDRSSSDLRDKIEWYIEELQND